MKKIRLLLEEGIQPTNPTHHLTLVSVLPWRPPQMLPFVVVEGRVPFVMSPSFGASVVTLQRPPDIDGWKMRKMIKIFMYFYNRKQHDSQLSSIMLDPMRCHVLCWFMFGTRVLVSTFLMTRTNQIYQKWTYYFLSFMGQSAKSKRVVASLNFQL